MPSYYKNSVRLFLKENTDNIVGILAQKYAHDGFVNLINKQILAWKKQIEILRDSFNSLELINNIIDKWTIILEYTIPMIGQRIDSIILTQNEIIVIEFKTGTDEFNSVDKKQLLNYVMDLQDFHFESRGRVIVPILIASESNIKPSKVKFENLEMYMCGKKSLKDIFIENTNILTDDEFNHTEWINSNFLPTPDIIQSAQLLFASQGVDDIITSIAESDILVNTSNKIIKFYEEARDHSKKSICFITGVPGSGKTLVGLNVIHNKDISDQGIFNGSFISGNVPLILLLREALARDTVKRKPEISITYARQIVQAYLHKVHLFIQSHIKNIPEDNLLVFDEAQRAWDKNMANSKGLENSEPYTILDIMNRKEWCLIVALVGEGQEIFKGEAGIQEWLNVLNQSFHNWNVYMSNELKENVNTKTIDNLIIDNDLNLKVSVRSIRSNYLSNWVENVLDLNNFKAIDIKQNKLIRYPIFITRQLELAKKFIKYEKNDLERNGRYGLIASSGARRLRPYGITVQESHKIEEWFLNDNTDIRSSNFLELVMTEFSIQGLELDWACICWDADLRIINNNWEFFEFKGTKWNIIRNSPSGLIRKKYLINKYRVLLTRAREGIVIFVPEGSSEDKTRARSIYDETYEYLLSCGAEAL